MHVIESTLVRCLSNQPLRDIIIAYSGGVDSQVLLFALARLKVQGKISNNISVCHVNHGLNSQAKMWQEFAEQQCKKLSLPLKVHQLNLVKKSQQSLEALARDARYQAIISCSHHSVSIVTGHHLNDQAETLLLALKRGAGVKGMSAMSQATPLAQHTLVRPLLNTTRVEIENYAKAQGLAWIEDDSNQDQSFDRNFIRQSVMPLLSARWPSIAKTIARSAALSQDAQSLLDEIAHEDLENISLSSQQLSVALLLKLSEPRFNNVIRHFLSLHKKDMPSVAQLQQLRQQLCSSQDKTPELKFSDYYLRRYQDCLFLTTDFADISNWQTELPIALDTKEQFSSEFLPYVVKLPDDNGEIFCEYVTVEEVKPLIIESESTYLRLPDVNEKITVRFCHDNPKCLPHYRNKSRPLKKILQEAKIPRWQRHRIPFIYYNETLVSGLGLFVDKGYLAQANQSCIKLGWRLNKRSG